MSQEIKILHALRVPCLNWNCTQARGKLPRDHSLELLGCKAPIQVDSASSQATNKVCCSWKSLFRSSFCHLSIYILPLSSAAGGKRFSAFFAFLLTVFAELFVLSNCLMWMCVVHNELACNDRRCAGHWLWARDRSLRASQPATRTMMCLHALCAHFTFVWSNDTLASQNNTHELNTKELSPPPKRSMHPKPMCASRKCLKWETVNHNQRKEKP